MAPLPDPEHNLEPGPESLDWPNGALAVVTALRTRHPHHVVYYSHGGTDRNPKPGYYAYLRSRPWRRPAFGTDAQALEAAIAQDYKRLLATSRLLLS